MEIKCSKKPETSKNRQQEGERKDKIEVKN
jgi:hypothetical protein